jgi:predicted nucleic acid-binding protein
MALVLLDSNVLVHASYRESPFFEDASKLVDRGMRERGRYCIAPQNLVEFCSAVTRSPKLVPHMSFDDVNRVVQTLYQSRRLMKIYPKRGTVIRAVREGARLGIRGTVWYDLFLAITMRDSEVQTIITENTKDFEQIPFVTALPICHGH